jgi:hypothetical protein
VHRLVVAFAVFSEMRDAMLCEIALRDISQKRQVPRGWKLAIGGLSFARYYVFLPYVVYSVMSLVLSDGGRVRDVCLNTVAVLFLLEVDNLAFLHGLSERVRMEAEENAGARQVTDDELRTMDAVKIVCVVAIPSVVFVGILGHNLADQFLSDLLAPLPSILAVLVQCVRANGRRGACAGLALGIAGFVVFWLWFFAVLSLMVYQAQGAGGLDEG